MWNESRILIRLTQAKKLLEGLNEAKIEDFNLWQFRVRADGNLKGEGGGDSLEIARVKTSEKEHESSFGVKFLLGLLKCPNQVLAHAAINALVALSDFLRDSRRDLWPSFVLALWKDAKYWAVSPGPLSLKKLKGYGKAFFQNGQSEFDYQTHEDACLIATSNTLQTLQQSLKRCLKLSEANSGNKLPPRRYVESLEIFLCILTTRVSKVTSVICIAENQDVEEQKNEPCISHPVRGLPRELVLGALLRLLCTGASIMPLVYDSKNLNRGSCEAYLDMSQDLIPIISRCALPLHKNCTGRSCISSYLRHKLLMLMLKLSEFFDCKPSLASSCNTALRRYGSDLLDFSLQMDHEEKKPADESPFIESLLVASKTETSAVPSIRRSQRRALLLLFKIAHAAHPSADTDRGSDRVTLPAKRSWGQLSPTCTCDLPSRMYLRDWMKKQYQLGVSGHTEEMRNLKGTCGWVNQLATALIQLYLEEDDLLLIMITQLLNMPFLTSIFMCPKHPTEDMFCRSVVEAFLPTRLFHAFLAAINFDHSTIEKLLISKSSGVLFLTYLMRSLRHVSDSWPEFVQRSPCADSKDHVLDSGDELNHCKTKSNTLRCISGSYGDICSNGVPYDCEEVTQKSTTLRRSPHEKLDRLCGALVSVDAAKQVDHPDLVLFEVAECFQRLKLRIEDLHGQALFPYNPTALLNRYVVVEVFERSSINSLQLLRYEICSFNPTNGTKFMTLRKLLAGLVSWLVF